ncbi:50S ribosomal protein L18 [Patescibacteria group bacterium]
MSEKSLKRTKRRKRIRAKIIGTNNCPRLSVFRSSKHIVAQLIDDEKSKTLLFISDRKISKKTPKKSIKAITGKAGTGKDRAYEVGKELAKKALAMKIKNVLFDRGGYLYHGRVEALAKGAREGGLKF